MIRYEIRAATEEDHAELLELARFLDTVNLPNDSDALREILDLSHRSFSRAVGDPRKREYLFVLRDLEASRIVGTSMVLGQLGRRDAPYIYLDVRKEEKYSATLDRHFIHKVLTIAYSFSGPTEVGGLVVHPEYRRSEDRLGILISYVRFLWIAMHRHEFQDQVLAELLPPLEPDGTSHLWEALGRHFTGLSYREADRLSKRNKEFIRNLFPDGDIYASVLSADAQGVIGRVGEQSRGVETMLSRAGFRYVDRIDPFDGGPHFMAQTDSILPVERTRRVSIEVGDPSVEASRALIGRELDGPPYFLAIACVCTFQQHVATISADAARRLQVSSGDSVWALPLGQ